MRIASGSKLKRRRLLGVGLHQVLVATDAREVVDVAGLRHADDGMDQQARFDILRRAERELLVRAVHRIAGLERHDPAPAELLKAIAKLLRSITQVLEIVMNRSIDSAQLAAEIDGVAARLQIADGRMLEVSRAVHRLRLDVEIRAIDARDLHRRRQDAFAVAQRDRVAFLELLGEFFA